jgi:hypothetical protein
MALHRDIFWIGRQWAVTGHGMQLIDQRLEGAFDIELIRLWDDDLIESLRGKAWIKAEDFDKGLAVARTRYPKPEAGSTPTVALPAAAIEAIAPPPPPKLERHATVESPQPLVSPAAKDPQPLSIELSPQELPGLQMKIDGGARFARPWRVWMKKT